MEEPKRKQLRLSEWDYSAPGCYFVTVCAGNKAYVFGYIPSSGVGCDDLGAPLVRLSPYGRIVKKYIRMIDEAYPNVTVDKYVIMPNHIHMSLRITEGERGAPGSSRPTQLVPRVMAALKRFTNREAGCDLWQTSYYDHIIRDEADYQRVWSYIDGNPAAWREDDYFTEIEE